MLMTARRTSSTGSHIHANITSTLFHPFKPLSHFKQPHHAQSSTRVLNDTTNWELNDNDSTEIVYSHAGGLRDAVNMCATMHPSLSPRVTQNHRPDTLTPV